MWRQPRRGLDRRAALVASAGLRARLGRTHFAEAAADVLPPVLDNLGRAVVSDDFILETENLTKEFAGFVAVSGVNLRVARGTIHALIGPNGAGKTTCFNLLTKFMRPTRGRIVYKGRDITTLPAADVARLGTPRGLDRLGRVPRTARPHAFC